MTIRYVLTLSALAILSGSQAQYFGTVWKGRVGEPGPGRTWEVELKLEQSGDSVKGVSYYQGYGYRNLQMPVRGFVDPADGSLSWWHASDYGIDDEGRRAIDPMPLGIRYRLGFNRENDSTESLKGKVSMSVWSGEKWEKEVRFEKAARYSARDLRIEKTPEGKIKSPVASTPSVTSNPKTKTTPPASVNPSKPAASKSAGKSVAAPKPVPPATTTPSKPADLASAAEKLSVKTEASKSAGKSVAAPKPVPPATITPSKPADLASAAEKPSVNPEAEKAITDGRKGANETVRKDPNPVQQKSASVTVKKATPPSPEAATKPEAKVATAPKPVPVKTATVNTVPVQAKKSPTSSVTNAAKPKVATAKSATSSVKNATVKTETSALPPPVKSEGTESSFPSEAATVVKLSPLLSRDRILMEEVVVHGDTLWLNFYDPAEVDGDTVSVYLGDKPIATGVGLGLQPHVMGIPVVSLPDNAELTMYAENMGRIPPNTAILVLYIAGERREIRLESSDRASAVVRFLRPSPMKR